MRLIKKKEGKKTEKQHNNITTRSYVTHTHIYYIIRGNPWDYVTGGTKKRKNKFTDIRVTGGGSPVGPLQTGRVRLYITTYAWRQRDKSSASSDPYGPFNVCRVNGLAFFLFSLSFSLRVIDYYTSRYYARYTRLCIGLSVRGCVIARDKKSGPRVLNRFRRDEKQSTFSKTSLSLKYDVIGRVISGTWGGGIN